MTLQFFFLNHVELDTSVVFSILFAADRRRDRVVSAGERAHIGGYISRHHRIRAVFSLESHERWTKKRNEEVSRERDIIYGQRERGGAG